MAAPVLVIARVVWVDVVEDQGGAVCQDQWQVLEEVDGTDSRDRGQWFSGAGVPDGVCGGRGFKCLLFGAEEEPRKAEDQGREVEG